MPPTGVQTAWQVYSSELAMLGHGLALWQPAPLHNYDKVNIGDVGYIRQGRFHLLFSASLPLGDRRPGVDVPLNFVPIDPGPTVKDQPRVPGALHTQYIEQKGAGFSASSEITCIDIGTTLQFESSSKRGAILLTKYKTFCEDAERLGFFKDYLLRHNHSWVDFANQLGHMVNLEDILLVTGHDMTLDFAMLAFSSNSRQIGIEFEAGMPAVASASASVWGSWRTTMSVHHNCGPQHREPPKHPNTLVTEESGFSTETGPQYNQCVFLRGFRIRRRAGFIPTVIKAAAGPHDLGPGRRFEEDGPLLFTEDSVADSDDEEVIFDIPPKFIDPLDPLYYYIFENSTADAVLLHDLDLAELLKFTGTSTAEDMKVLVSRLSPNMIELGPNGIASLKIPPHGSLNMASVISESMVTVRQNRPQDRETIAPFEADFSGDQHLAIQNGHVFSPGNLIGGLFSGDGHPEIQTGNFFDPEESLDVLSSDWSDRKPSMENDRIRRSEIYDPNPSTEHQMASKFGSKPKMQLPESQIRRVPEMSSASEGNSPTENVRRSRPLMPLGKRKPFSERSLNQPEDPQKSSLSVFAAKARVNREPPSPARRRHISGVASARPLPPRPLLSTMGQAQRNYQQRPLPPRPVLSPMVQAQRDFSWTKHRHELDILSSFGALQRFLIGLSASPKMRSRPPFPIGPRKPLRRNALVFNANMRMPVYTSAANLHLSASGSDSRSELILGSPKPQRSGNTSMHMILQSWEASSISLPPGVLVEKIHKLPDRLKALLEEFKFKYRALVRRRRVLARSISRYEGESDAHACASLSQELVDVSLACDRFSQDLVRAMDELQQINNLGESLSENAITVTLRDLNSSFSKLLSEMFDLKLQMVQLEVERNETWKIAERYNHESLATTSSLVRE